MNSLKNVLADVVEIENRGRFHPHVSLINFPVLFLGFDFVEDEIRTSLANTLINHFLFNLFSSNTLNHD